MAAPGSHASTSQASTGTKPSRHHDRWTIVLALFSAGTLANAIWMLVDPAGWYVTLPGAVPDTGPLNVHFVRDIGGASMALGAALLVAAFRPSLRPLLVFVSSIFYWLHAIVHASDTLSGRLPPSHWVLDFPTVYLPAIGLLGLVIHLASRSRVTE